MHHSSKALILAAALLCTGTAVTANDACNGGHVGIVRSISAHTLGKTGINLGAALRLATDRDYVSGPWGVGDPVKISSGASSPSGRPVMMSSALYFGVGILDKWDMALSLPIYADFISTWEQSSAGIGDLEFSTKLAHPFEMHNAFFSQSYYLKISLPSGAAARGFFPRHAYYMENDSVNAGDHPFGAKSVLFNPMMLWTLDFGRISNAAVQLHVNFGGVVTSIKNNSSVVAAIGLEYAPSDMLDLFCEISGESRVKWYTDRFSVRSFDNDAFWVSPGLRIKTPQGLNITVAGDFGVSERRQSYRATWMMNDYHYSTAAVPSIGGHLSIGWMRRAINDDRDKDGIKDKFDKCPDEPEDMDGFEDEDGCPDLDNDKDGILDVNDKCPNEPAECSGCPVLDKDNDGIKDTEDKCINEPEDRDGFEDEDGCPDPDNDKDGILDKDDKCLDQPEDLDGFEDSDGCPDPDNDKDGIPDSEDKCPNHPGLAENNGCPKSEEIKRGPIILHGVTFKSGSAELNASSYAMLDKVYESLVEWPEISLEIQGHTDSRGDDALNRKLSQRRAESVAQYFYNKGISAARLRAIGYGEDTPIADNNTAEGRAQNRRVELRRLD